MNLAQSLLDRPRSIAVEVPSVSRWMLAGMIVGATLCVQLLLAGRLVVQLMGADGPIAGLVFSVGGFLQSPFGGETSLAATHGVFQPETLHAVALYSMVAGVLLLIVAGSWLTGVLLRHQPQWSTKHGTVVEERLSNLRRPASGPRAEL